MADTLAVDIKASLVWLFQDTLDLSIVADVSKLEYAAALADGTAENQADRLWHDQRTVAASANDDLDLTALARTFFGSAVTIELAKVKVLLIVNMATAAGEDLLVGGAAAAAWAAPFGAAAHKVRVPADSCLLLTNRKSGWDVTNGSSDVLRIANAGTGDITYRVAIIGTSA